MNNFHNYGFNLNLNFIYQEKKFFTALTQFVSKIRETDINDIEAVPVPLEDICNKHKIKIEYVDLDYEIKNNQVNNRTIGKLHVYKNLEWNIDFSTISINRKTSNAVKRYALAHEIAHFFVEKCTMDDSQTNMIDDFSLLFPSLDDNDLKEILVDYVAIVLLVPESFLRSKFEELMQDSVTSDEFDIDMELMYLSNSAQVPLYVLVQAMQLYKVKNAIESSDKN